MNKVITPPLNQLYFELTIETKRVGRDHHTGRMVVFADTREAAIQGLQDVVSGKISMKDIPKTGLDLRTVPLAPDTEFDFSNAKRSPVIRKSGFLTEEEAWELERIDAAKIMLEDEQKSKKGDNGNG